MLDSLAVCEASVAVYVLCRDEPTERVVRDRLPQARIITPGDLSTFRPDSSVADLPRLVAAMSPNARTVTWVAPSVVFYGTADELFDAADAAVTVAGVVDDRPMPSWITWRIAAGCRPTLSWRGGEGVQVLPGAYGLVLRSGSDENPAVPDGGPERDGHPLVFADFHNVGCHASGAWDLPEHVPDGGTLHQLVAAYAERVGTVLAGLAVADPTVFQRPRRMPSGYKAGGAGLAPSADFEALGRRPGEAGVAAAVLAACGLANPTVLEWPHRVAGPLTEADGAVDVVFASGTLARAKSYESIIAESARVARRFCVFHAVPVTLQRPTSVLASPGCGPAEPVVILNEGELRLLLARHGLRVHRVWRCGEPVDLSSPAGRVVAVKTFLCAPLGGAAGDRPLLLNVGCGGHFDPRWVNMDVAAHDYGVLIHDAATGLPFPDQRFDGVYHSHVLEHLDRDEAPGFLRECYRVLKPGGVLRVVVPDLEQIARLYVETAAAAAAGDVGAVERYEWIVLELLDQLVRHEPGGAMGRCLSRRPVPAEAFIVDRIGKEALLPTRRTEPAPWWAPGHPTPRPRSADAVGRFRLSGEVHRWMYDRYSLSRLLQRIGFRDVQVRTATDSGLPAFVDAGLDAGPDGGPRKPDSLFVEGVKPR
ncbi:class I SAM-dependent methyltransferase [Azospirillum sp. Marseille-Q6669]